MPQPEEIRKLYEEAGLLSQMPEGKGMNTVAAHKCVISYLKKGVSKDEAWKRCVGGMGEKAITPEHRRAARNRGHKGK